MANSRLLDRGFNLFLAVILFYCVKENKFMFLKGCNPKEKKIMCSLLVKWLRGAMRLRNTRRQHSRPWTQFGRDHFATNRWSLRRDGRRRRKCKHLQARVERARPPWTCSNTTYTIKWLSLLNVTIPCHIQIKQSKTLKFDRTNICKSEYFTTSWHIRIYAVGSKC